MRVVIPIVSQFVVVAVAQDRNGISHSKRAVALMCSWSCTLDDDDDDDE
jgi:hypothetical protein